VTRSDLAAEASAAGPTVQSFLARFSRTPVPGGRRLELLSGTNDTASFETPSSTVLFEGVLHNGEQLAAELSLPASEEGTGPLLAAAYARLGADLLPRLSGTFAVVLRDDERDGLLAARDPLGLHPLFYTRSEASLFLSTSVDALVRQPGVRARPNAAALADHLCHRWPDLGETYFDSVKRVPPGHALRASPDGIEVFRYWDPAPGEIDWFGEQEVERFDELFERSVDRCLARGPTAVYLSGGLDSVAVAALAADSSRRSGTPAPLALSLVFEHPSANEEETQKGVAATLGLPQKLLRMSEAVGPSGLLWSALEMSATSPAPMLSLWNPAYHALGLEGRREGRKAILTGAGGDEWLGVNVVYAADLVRRGDVAGLYRLWQSAQRSYDVSGRQAARVLLWEFGARPILRKAAVRALLLGAPGTFAHIRQQRLTASTPAYVAPDARLRAELAARHDASFRSPDPRGFYVGAMRGQLDTPVIALQLEEYFERGRRLGVPLVHPFWDVDLAAFLWRTPPRFLMRGERTKGLVRHTLAERFPELGFREHRKLTADDFFTAVLRTEGRAAWKRLGGVTALAGLGVVDPRGAETFLEEFAGGRRPGEAFRLWYLLSVESWLRSRI
jgi:asparagine synthase (glutamine-hydrolysing)